MPNKFCFEFSLNEEKFAGIIGSKIEVSLEINSIVISNTPNVEKGAELLTKNWFKAEIQKFQNLFGIIFKIDDELDENLDIKPFLLCLGSEGSIFLTFQSNFGDHECKTCLKIHDCDKFYSISIDDDSSGCITAFFHEFLIEELKNEQTGKFNQFYEIFSE